MRLSPLFCPSEQSDWNILPCASLTLVLPKLLNMPLLLFEVEHWVPHCTVQCKELRPYQEKQDNDCFNRHLDLHCCPIKLSAPAFSEPIIIATVSIIDR